MAQTLRAFPASMFGAVMGLAGLGLVWRSGAAFLGLPPLVTEAWVAVAVLALVLLLSAYLLKAWRHPDAVREELRNPALLGFCATLPVGMTLVAGGLKPHAELIAQCLWWTGVALLVALQLRMIERLLRGGFALAQVNAGWMIVFIGGIVVPSSGLALGHAAVSTWIFCACALVSPVVMGLVAWRMLFGPPLPDAAKPTWFILLVPPALIYANGMALFGAAPGSPLETLYYGALVLLGVLLLAARGFARWPFGAPWWAFTFPLDALAAAGLRHAAGQDWALWRSIAGALLGLATLAVAGVLARTLWALARGRMFLPPAGTPSK
jgi:tellurite resistance protein